MQHFFLIIKMQHRDFALVRECRRGNLSKLKAALKFSGVDQMAYSTFGGHLNILKWILNTRGSKALTEDALVCYALKRKHLGRWFLRVSPTFAQCMLIPYGPEKSRDRLIEEYLNFSYYTSREEAAQDVDEQLEFENGVNQNKRDGVKFATRRALQLISFCSYY
jgi:hypothetical protein